MTDENISDQAVQEATGAEWATWFERLDDAGCRDMKHAAIAKHIQAEYGTPPWWCQMITVQYERARGMRAVNEATSGWQFSKQRTLQMSPKEAFEAVQALPGWQTLVAGEEVDLGFGSCTVRRVDQGLIRLWIHEPPGKSVLEISFTPKGDRTAVLFAHSSIASEAALKQWKARWTDVLAKL